MRVTDMSAPPTAARNPDLARTLSRVFGVLLRGRTYANLLYLSLCFPLGLLYAVVLGLGVGLGALLSVLLVGLLLLMGCLVGAWGFAMFERELAILLLGVDIPPMSVPGLEPAPARQRLTSHLRRSVTWKSLAFLVLKLPLGTVVAFGGVAALSASFGLLLTPFTLLSRGAAVARPGQVLGVAVLVLLGLALLVAAMHVSNWVAGAMGSLAVLMLGVGEDERLLWEARLRAEAADLSRRELVLNVSHELRTPIASIQGHVDTLLLPPEERPPDATPERYLHVVSTETRRLAALVEDLLVLARADSHELAMLVRPVELAPVVRDVVAAAAPLARRERHVTLAHPEALPELAALADPDRLTQVLTNLVRNAITHTPEGGAVFVQLGELAPNHVVVDVSDTGVGIAAEDRERIFERFYRADRSRSRDSGGFGLGLAIARELTEAMGGAITVTSEVGVGSSFHVSLRRARV
jgi:two-component system, OmpR family, phosphate regulon sensor histidine kinase PhoR